MTDRKRPPRRAPCGATLAGLAAVLLLAAACERGPGAGRLAEIQEHGALHVLTRNSPTTYYIGRNDVPEGLECDLAELYATSLGVATRYEVVGSVREILERLEAGDGDIGAAGISRTDDRRGRVRFGPGYQTVEQQVVCRRGGAAPSGVEDLAGLSLRVVEGTSYHERLAKLQPDYPELEFETVADETTEQLLRAVWERHFDCTVADSNLVAVTRRYYPELEARFTLGGPEALVWALPPGARRLQRSVEAWFTSIAEASDLDRLLERHYGSYEVFDYVDVRTFHRRIQRRLPHYEPHFREAAERTDLDWLLLAAVAYQESQWNPRARSPTGVRGLMMLTLNTAQSVGVTNRLDPVQSIHGGARYLRRLYDWLDDEIPEPDRTWLTLATYNVGMGHMRDAMELAERLGFNPHHWSDMREVLPLLADPDHYRDLRFGYARGHEPVRFVQRVRDFHDMLARLVGEDAGEVRASAPATGS